jgi:non-specific serine/threonine protein kinase
VWWVELAPVAGGGRRAGHRRRGPRRQPAAGRPLAAALEEALRGAAGAPRHTLLVLDNCEHVVDAAAALAEALLRAAPGLTVLATSREALAIEGEVAWPAPPLASPPAGRGAEPGARPAPGAPGARAAAVAEFEAVQLFVERARAASPGFALTDANAAAVAAVCARLDGLPLALELAAAALPAFGIDTLAARLDDALGLLTRGRRTALPRHRTLRAVLDWSYALLAEDERALLRRLSVFRGSFTLDAVEAVCAPAEAAGRADVVPALGRLVEHSLVEVREDDGDARYRLLETVRQYGAALLRGTPRSARRARATPAGWPASPPRPSRCSSAPRAAARSRACSTTSTRCAPPSPGPRTSRAGARPASR